MNNHRGDFIGLEGLSKCYHEGGHPRQVLQDIQASFSKGEYVAILGKNGSGKSTLLNLISDIDRADSGTVCINGQNLTAIDERQCMLFRRSEIGFIFQFFNLISTLTVLENVSLRAELMGITSQEARFQAGPLLDAVGLLDRLKTFPDRLSGGEQQRVAIARALINYPLLVLADEPPATLTKKQENMS